MSATRHIPVLVQEVIEGLQCQHGGVFLDCTIGGGGHSEVILKCHPHNRVIGIDRDATALQVAKQRLETYGDRISLHHERFESFEKVLQECFSNNKEKPVIDGILFDLGISSLQLEDAERGFSFQQAGWLDMRMDQHYSGNRFSQTAYAVVNTYSAEQLSQIFFQYGEERWSQRIANTIVKERDLQPIQTTTQLAAVIERAIPKRNRPKTIHPATRVFQAIRIEVNEELKYLGETIERSVQYLRPDGRICVISFHSLEDRIVKRTFMKLAKGCQCPPEFPECVCGIAPSLIILSKKPIVPTEDEQQQNPRARSAKLRIAQKLGCNCEV